MAVLVTAIQSRLLLRAGRGADVPIAGAMAKRGFVYILASRKHGTLYTGVTSNLSARIHQHKEGTGSRFTHRYKVDRLVYFETFELVTDAIRRENTIKGWPRAWKIRTIEAVNPDWKDLTEEMWFD